MHLLIRFHQFFQSSGCRAGVGDRIIYRGGGGGGGGLEEEKKLREDVFLCTEANCVTCSRP